MGICIEKPNLQPSAFIENPGLQKPQTGPVLFCRQVLLGPHAPVEGRQDEGSLIQCDGRLSRTHAHAIRSRAGADETPVDTTSKIVTLPTGQRITKTLEASLMLTFWLAASSSSVSSSSAASKRPFHS